MRHAILAIAVLLATNTVYAETGFLGRLFGDSSSEESKNMFLGSDGVYHPKKRRSSKRVEQPAPEATAATEAAAPVDEFSDRYMAEVANPSAKAKGAKIGSGALTISEPLRLVKAPGGKYAEAEIEVLAPRNSWEAEMATLENQLKTLPESQKEKREMLEERLRGKMREKPVCKLQFTTKAGYVDFGPVKQEAKKPTSSKSKKSVATSETAVAGAVLTPKTYQFGEPNFVKYPTEVVFPLKVRSTDRTDAGKEDSVLRCRGNIKVKDALAALKEKWKIDLKLEKKLEEKPEETKLSDRRSAPSVKQGKAFH